MATEYGKKIDSALRAVAQLHKDSSKLLVDFDSRIETGWYSVFGNFATSELTYHVRAPCWMARGVYRYYAHEQHPGLVEGVAICFIERSLDEPVFLAARLKYNQEGGKEIKSVCEPWDIWNLYFKKEKPQMRTVLTIKDAEGARINETKLLAVPLYSIQMIEDVEGLLNELRTLDT
jgi:hypothetical protein